MMHGQRNVKFLGNVYCMADRLKQYGYFATMSTDYVLFCGWATDIRHHL